MTNLNLTDSEAPESGADKLAEYEDAIKQLLDTGSHDSPGLLATIDELLADINREEDPVYQGNCLQMVADIASFQRGLLILEQKNVPQRLLAILEKRDPLIVAHALKFFYHVNPEEFGSKYSKALDIVLDYLVSESLELVDYAVDMIAAISRHGYRGRKVLAEHSSFRTESLKKLGNMMVASNGLLKTRTLDCIKDLLEVYEEEPAKEEAIKLSEDFYHSLIEGELKTTTQLLRLCENPFKEIGSRAQSILSVICDYDWLKKELESRPELKKFIKEKHPLEYSVSHT